MTIMTQFFLTKIAKFKINIDYLAKWFWPWNNRWLRFFLDVIILKLLECELIALITIKMFLWSLNNILLILWLQIKYCVVHVKLYQLVPCFHIYIEVVLIKYIFKLFIIFLVFEIYNIFDFIFFFYLISYTLLLNELNFLFLSILFLILIILKLIIWFLIITNKIR